MITRNSIINFDVNATYGVDAQHFKSVDAICHGALNPSSVHRGGQQARAIIEECRDSIRAFLSAPASTRVTFTSGATEANNLAIFGSQLSDPAKFKNSSVVVSAVEHPSVLACVERLEQLGVSITQIKPRSDGSFHVDDFLSAANNETRLVSVMLANNESGQILPVADITSALKKAYPQVLVHCDAVQAAGKIPISMTALGVDYLTLSAHKIGGLPGVGALVSGEHITCNPLVFGGPQEGRLRAGTENIFGIASFGLIINEVSQNLDDRLTRFLVNRDYLKKVLLEIVDDIVINFTSLNLLPNTLSITFPGIRADDLVVALDLEGVMISSGAACASGKQQPSHVLTAMGFSKEKARETIRISLGAMHEKDELDYAAETINRVIRRMRNGKLENKVSSVMRSGNAS